MLEIEKKFELRPGDKERLIRDAAFIQRKTFTDVYYDVPDNLLTRRDFWLRARDGRFELKVPLGNGSIGGRKTDQYRELESNEEIARELNLHIATSLENALAEAGYLPFAKITTVRETYRKGDFRLDFDETDFGFAIFEVELMLTDGSDVDGAETRILEFAREHGIVGTGVHGKVIEYISRNRPEHYAALVASGVIED